MMNYPPGLGPSRSSGNAPYTSQTSTTSNRLQSLTSNGPNDAWLLGPITGQHLAMTRSIWSPPPPPQPRGQSQIRAVPPPIQVPRAWRRRDDQDLSLRSDSLPLNSRGLQPADHRLRRSPQESNYSWTSPTAAENLPIEELSCRPLGPITGQRGGVPAQARHANGHATLRQSVMIDSPRAYNAPVTTLADPMTELRSRFSAHGIGQDFIPTFNATTQSSSPQVSSRWNADVLRNVIQPSGNNSHGIRTEDRTCLTYNNGMIRQQAQTRLPTTWTSSYQPPVPGRHPQQVDIDSILPRLPGAVSQPQAGGRGLNMGREMTTVSELQGRVVVMGLHHYGSLKLQEVFAAAPLEEKWLLLNEMIPMLYELSTDVYGNYVIQKVFDCDDCHIVSRLADLLSPFSPKLSFNTYGCRVVQKAFERVTVQHQVAFVSRLEDMVIKLICNQNGNHVVQQAINRVPEQYTRFIFAACQDSLAALSKHIYGCRVVQRLIESTKSEPNISILYQTLHDHAEELIPDNFGNYVVQHVMYKGRKAEAQRMRQQVKMNLEAHIVSKFASNVVEAMLHSGTSQDLEEIMIRLLQCDTQGAFSLRHLVHHSYANYVLQTLVGLLLSQPNHQNFRILRKALDPELAHYKATSNGQTPKMIDNMINLLNEPSIPRPDDIPEDVLERLNIQGSPGSARSSATVPSLSYSDATSGNFSP